MQIFVYFFDVIREIYRVCNRDFLGLGFGYMDFILASLLLITIIKFSFNGSDSLSRGSFSSIGLDIFSNKMISNKSREEQLIKENGIVNGYRARHADHFKHKEGSYEPKHGKE